MANVPKNTLVTLTVNGQAGSVLQAFTNFGLSTGIPETTRAISAALQGYGFTVVSNNLKATNIIPAFTWPFSGTVVLRPQFDIEDSDLRDQVANAINDATGNSADVAITGTVDASNADPNTAAPGAFDGFTKSFEDLFAKLEGDAGKLLIGAVVAVLAVALIIGYAPNVKTLSRVQL